MRSQLYPYLATGKVVMKGEGITVVEIEAVFLKGELHELKFGGQLRVLEWLLVNILYLYFNDLLYGSLLLLSSLHVLAITLHTTKQLASSQSVLRSQ